MTFDRGHALLVGVGSYQHIPHLNGPITANDARAVAQVLRDPRFCGYPEDQLTILHDTSADRATILAALDKLAAATSPDDTVLLFYCGHGDFGDDGDYYLTSHDTRIIAQKVVGGTGVSMRVFLQKLQAIRAKRVLVIFNACLSGANTSTLGSPQMRFGRGIPHNTASALLATGPGRIIITACREQQFSYSSGGSLTLFTQVLVQGLLGKGISSQNGYISAFDLYSYLYSTISQRARQEYGSTQEPELTILKNAGSFAVALYRGAATFGATEGTIPVPRQSAVREVTAETSQQALQDILRQGVEIGSDVRGGNAAGHDQQIPSVSGSQRAIQQAAGQAAQQRAQQQAAQSNSAISRSGQGSIFGRLVVNTITINSTDLAETSETHQADRMLDQVLAWTHQAITRARRSGAGDLIADLEDVAQDIDAALKAERQDNPDQRTISLEAAHATLIRLAGQQTWLQELIRAIEQLK